MIEILDEATEGQILSVPTEEADAVALGDRLLRELADCRAEQKANAKALIVELERIQHGYVDLQRPLAAKEERLLGLLEQIAHVLPLRGKKSRNLAFGTIGWRTHPEKLEVVSEEELKAWLDSLEFAVAAETQIQRKVVTVKIEKKALDHYVEHTGVLPPGVQRVAESQKFYATPSEPHS